MDEASADARRRCPEPGAIRRQVRVAWIRAEFATKTIWLHRYGRVGDVSVAIIEVISRGGLALQMLEPQEMTSLADASQAAFSLLWS
ncbi:hypothetical protein Aph02nite_68420 [Actinoplanes philippinensis]|nr:hypothetical protein Aph02nite_68420 [Actinoplanes philippinensis]